jgi:hypothetical protein
VITLAKNNKSVVSKKSSKSRSGTRSAKSAKKEPVGLSGAKTLRNQQTQLTGPAQAKKKLKNI